ncbi:MAG: hypothetical protein KKH98_05260 [Spirochaetes bacterium]|nr:hypothetical protein [Spirochaetota bacterium]
MKLKTIMIILVLSLSLSVFMVSCSKSGEFAKQTYNTPEAKVGDKVVCPVMDTQFTVKEDSQYVMAKGKKIYVCCPSCMDSIKADPDKYLKK